MSRSSQIGTNLLLAAIVAGCGPAEETATDEAASAGPVIERGIERFTTQMDALIAPGTEVEILAEGFTWSEGPVWVEDGGYILFSDVPENRIHKWSESEGLSVWLEPSGYTGDAERTGGIGSNGLVIDAAGRLILAQHGDRRIAVLDAPFDAPEPRFVTVADRWENMRFSSPNDLVYDRTGNLYFTDPPFGLPERSKDPEKEIPFNGVFRVSVDGSVTLLDDMTRLPNGIALSPDESTLYVTGSQTNTIIAYTMTDDHDVTDRRVFADMSSHEGTNGADGIKVDVDGNVFSTGPGGVHVFAPDGTELGIIRTVERCANLAWGDDGSTLYLTADMYLMRVRTLTSGV